VKIFQGFLDLFKNRAIIGRMAYKEVTDHYAGSALGLVWAILQPLFLIALYTFIFTFVFKVRITTTDSPFRYAFYAMAGLIPWISMSASLSKSVLAISSKASLVKQAIFPTETLPVSAIVANFTPLFVGLIIYLIMMLIWSPQQFSYWILLLPLVILIHFIFTLGVGYFLAIAGAYFRDLTEIVTLLLTVGMFVTPILYIEGMVPKPLVILMNFNLLAHLIYMYRDILYFGQINHPWSFVIFSSFAIFIFILGHYSFRKIKHYFANVL